MELGPGVSGQALGVAKFGKLENRRGVASSVPGEEDPGLGNSVLEA